MQLAVSVATKPSQKTVKQRWKKLTAGVSRKDNPISSEITRSITNVRDINRVQLER